MFTLLCKASAVVRRFAYRYPIMVLYDFKFKFSCTKDERDSDSQVPSLSV